MKKKNNLALTTSDKKLIQYLHTNKVASSKQINRDVYKNHLPQSMRKCLKKLRDNGLIGRVRPLTDKDKSYLYSLTKHGLKLIKRILAFPLVNDRFKSDSVDHDLSLVDIKRTLLKKSMVVNYYTENQIQSYVKFDESSQLKVFKRLLVDALVFCKKASGKGAYFAIQYEPTQKSVSRYKRIITDYYTESSLNFIFYICSSNTIENKIKEIEKEISRESDKKIYFIQLKDLIAEKKAVKFINQDNETIEVI